MKRWSTGHALGPGWSQRGTSGLVLRAPGWFDRVKLNLVDTGVPK